MSTWQSGRPRRLRCKLHSTRDLDDAHDMPDELMQMNGAVDDDTLRLSYHLIRQRWTREDRTTAAAISPLKRPWDDPSTLSFESFTPMTVDSMSGIRQDVSSETLDLWSDLIKGTQTSNTADNAHAATNVTQTMHSIDSDDEGDECDSNADDEYAVLEPVLTFDESTTGPQIAGACCSTWPKSLSLQHSKSHL